MFENGGIVSIDQLVSAGIGKILLGNVRSREDSCSTKMVTQLADLLGQIAIWGLQLSPPSDVAASWWHTRNLEVKSSRLAHLSQSQWDQFQRVAIYCGIGSASGLPLHGSPGLPLRTAPSATRFIAGAAPPPVTRVSGVACRAPLLSGPALGPGVPTPAATMPPRVV